MEIILIWRRKGKFKRETEFQFRTEDSNHIRTNYLNAKFDKTYQKAHVDRMTETKQFNP